MTPKNSRDMSKAELLQEFIVVQEALSKANQETLFAQQKTASAKKALDEVTALLREAVAYASAMATCELINGNNPNDNLGYTQAQEWLSETLHKAQDAVTAAGNIG